MPGLFLAKVAAPAPPPVPFNPFPGIQAMSWEGWDGTIFDVLNPGSVFLTKGIRGLNAPDYTTYRQSSPGLHGSRYRGSRVQAREVFWPMFVYSDKNSQDWLEHDRALWRTLHPDKPGFWTVTATDGTSRRLALRFEGDGGHTSDHDPQQMGWELYGLTLVADQPFWEDTSPIVRSWSGSATRKPFFGAGTSTGGAPFYISAGSTLSAAKMPNPGDEDGYIKWRITGPTTSVSVGVDGRMIDVPFGLAAGEKLIIDTAPDVQSAYMEATGVDRTRELGEADFAPVPPGVAPLSLSMFGTGLVEAELTPLHRRAW